MNIAMLNELAELKARRKQLEADAKKLKTREEELSDDLVDMFVAEGVKRVGTSDGRLAYLHSQLWANRKPEHDAIDVLSALRASGALGCEQVGTQKLSALIREEGEDAFFEARPNLREILKTDTKVSIRIRNS